MPVKRRQTAEPRAMVDFPRQFDCGASVSVVGSEFDEQFM